MYWSSALYWSKIVENVKSCLYSNVSKTGSEMQIDRDNEIQDKARIVEQLKQSFKLCVVQSVHALVEL